MTPQAQARLQDSVFARLGENASWTGVTGAVRVCRREYDEALRLERSTVIETGVTIRVRKSEVPAPAIGNQVQMLDDDGNAIAGDLYAINGRPKLDRKGVWHCQASPSA